MSRVGSGQEVLQISRVGSGQQVFKSRGSGRVGSRGFQISGVGSGRANRFSNLPGRVRSGHEEFKMPRVTMTRELFFADARVGPADLARRSVFVQTYSGLPESHYPCDPRV